MPILAASPNSPFRERIVTDLIPYFIPLTGDVQLARADIIETLDSYGARTRSEMINAMRIIALSFTSMDLLAKAKNPDITADLELYYIRQANSVARTCQQNENALAKRLALDVLEPAEEPANDITDAELEAQIQEARALFATIRKPPAIPRARPESPEESNQRPWDTTFTSGTARPPAPA
jgi:hypothetical protein